MAVKIKQTAFDGDQKILNDVIQWLHRYFTSSASGVPSADDLPVMCHLSDFSKDGMLFFPLSIV